MGFESQEEIDALEKFFPTKKKISHLGEVRQAEWDVLLMKGGDAAPEPHLYVLAFGMASVGGVEYKGNGVQEKAKGMYGQESRATEFIIPDNIDSDIGRLVGIDILPRLRAEKVHRCLAIETVLSEGLAIPVFTSALKGPWFRLCNRSPTRLG
ncbi:hypothetical protein [Cystobacter fuscus]|uniref:hypothetical protein n=1 Tax=Cystobacter fuscus TaxID=43 RepID=UPI002B2E1FF1|nr:hypothetical protein F0U63_23940 [Cystobacter fuscus]